MQSRDSKSWLDLLIKVTGNRSKVGKLIEGYKKLQEANYISSHFSSYLSPVLAFDETLKTEVFKIRHGVYCEELSFEPTNRQQQEIDDFDAFSVHGLIQHRNSNAYAGTVRIVTPQEDSHQLPIEKYCLNSITDNKLNPSQFPRHEVCEVSRLAVPAAFRRRQMDKFDGAAVGGINQQTFSVTELRCFPFIAVGLYFSAAAYIVCKDIKHTYVMMEPRLARSMRFVGIQFEQIGPVVDYHGKRAPFYINPSLLYKGLSPGFKTMFAHIQKDIRSQLKN
ncbi:PEP-CTERM/exosortase system-associated acyltransferase [Aestuariibacter salexigens]|uniref:PEP-CTERM/exosortase system-associated acyltransferase n=1 Tax=Aestuariibacter salexigens TaxID=226010 RepID=UPI0004269570|nr:PEP-CTERM/exosortase system-associated acyltransferase [Aestuariibacter salexigens]